MNHPVQPALSFDEAIMKCTDTLQSKHNVDHSLFTLLGILGQFYRANSSFIFEFEEDTQSFRNYYQWNQDSDEPYATGFEELSFSALDYFSAEDLDCGDEPILTFDTKNFPDSPISTYFEERSVSNIMLYPMSRKKHTAGFVALTNLDFEFFDSCLFGCVILFVQECIQKREMNLQLAVLHNLDPLTGCFNHTQYQKKIAHLEQVPPEKLGILFARVIGLEKTSEIYGAKYVDVKIKNAASVLGHFFDYPFYRIDEHTFTCFVPNMEESSFLSIVEQLRVETTINSDASFTVGHTWSSGNIQIQQEIEKSTLSLNEDGATLGKRGGQTFRTPTECLSDDLCRAIDRAEFLVYLQPKVRLDTQEIVGAEALVRRVIPKTGKIIPPDVFVPLYEHHSIIRTLDMHVLEGVCRNLSQWLEFGVAIPISVNFSRITLMESGIAQTIAAMCEKYMVPTSLIHLEITERLSTSADDLTSLAIADFKHLGLSLVLDDFGSTYSNFLSLTKVDVKELKIDHSLIQNMEHSVKNRKILQSIITMCQTLDSTVSLAEGIETEAQRQLLLDLKCSFGQGFLFSKPIPMDDFYQKFLKKSTP